MYVDLLNSNNYISINISLIQLAGLKGAVYISEILNIVKKAIIKDKLIDNLYIKVDRKYICSRTTISTEEQREIDLKLHSLDLIQIHKDSPDIISVDVAGIVAMIAESDKNLEQINIEAVSNLKNVLLGKTKSEMNNIKSKAIAKALKKSISSHSPKIKTSLFAWIDEIMSTSSLSKEEVINFQNKLFKYTSDEVLALNIINIAIKYKYSNIDLAIRKYEKDNNNCPRCTTQIRATKEEFEKGKAF